MSKPHVYHPGDRVRIINPRFIKRVGYPLRWDDLIDTVEVEQRARTMLGAAGHYAEAPRYFLQAVAKLLVEERGFGGNERQIIYHDPDSFEHHCLSPLESWIGHTTDVRSKRVAHTGTRIPERSGTSWTADGRDDWHEPGGLENRKTHILLTLSMGEEIEACDVELVRAAS